MSKLQDVADLAGVSKTTVSRFINNSNAVALPTRKKVLEAMQKLDVQAQELKRPSEGTMTIGLILPIAQQIATKDFGIDILVGAEEKTFEQDYDMIIGNSHGVSKEKNLVTRMLNRDVEGIILLSSAQEEDIGHLKTLENSGVPFVMVDQKIENVSANIIRGDNFSNSIKLMNHLFELGHERIAIIAATKHSTFIDRFRGYQFSFLERGLEVEEKYIVRLTHQREEDEARIRELFLTEPRPTAVMLNDSSVLLRMLPIIEEIGLRYPYDLSIVVFDDGYMDLPEPYADVFTAVNQTGKMFGRLAVEVLFQQMQDPTFENQEIVLPGKLHIRKSTGPAKS